MTDGLQVFGGRDSRVSERKGWEPFALQRSLGTMWPAAPTRQRGLCLPAGMLTCAWGPPSGPGTSAASGGGAVDSASATGTEVTPFASRSVSVPHGG